MDINNPHDKVIKILGKNKKNAMDLIRGTFPDDILQKLDLETLTTML